MRKIAACARVEERDLRTRVFFAPSTLGELREEDFASKGAADIESIDPLSFSPWLEGSECVESRLCLRGSKKKERVERARGKGGSLDGRKKDGSLDELERRRRSSLHTSAAFLRAAYSFSCRCKQVLHE